MRRYSGAATGRVASPSVSQDQQALRVGIALASFLPPPSSDGGYGERGSLVRDADEHGTAIGVGIIDAIQNGDALGQRAKVMVVDRRGHTIPPGAGVLEGADHFPFLGIYADNRVALPAEALA